MKKAMLLVLFICLTTTIAHAQEHNDIRFASIFNEWDASDANGVYTNILEHMKNTSVSEPAGAFTPNYRPCSIRFGGTTETLIQDRDNWDLAIVSSKDVDLQKIANAGLIMKKGYDPSNKFALHQWLISERLQALLPSDPLMLYYIYFYDYDAQNDDATVLICQADIGHKQNSPRIPFAFADEIMEKRTIDSIRALEGIRIARRNSETDLVTHDEEWDLAIITIDADDKLELLSQADLLFDFSSNDYFASRTDIRPLENISSVGYCRLANGIYSLTGQMIGIPCSAIREDEYNGKIDVLVLNKQSANNERAQAYAVHWIKSLEWAWTTEDKMWPHGWDLCIFKEQVDW